MALVLKFAGVCVVILGLKFVWKVFQRVGSKTSIDGILDKAEDGMDKAADTVVGYFKTKAKKKKDDERPIVTIR